MRNIIGLLYRYNAVFVFIVLQVFAIMLLVSFNPYHRASYFNSSSTLIGSLKEITSAINEPFTAKEQNRQLRIENAELRNNLPNNFYSLKPEIVSINDTIYEQQYTYISAKVIDNSYTKTRNYILINAGRNKGIKQEMGVIGPNGLVGFVKDVSSRYALIIPIINPDFSTAVLVSKHNYPGSVRWKTNDFQIASVTQMSKTAPLDINDTIVTKGGRGRFPTGIPVGKVLSFEEIQGENDYQIDIELFTNFANLHHVYVIENKFQNEIDSIRTQIPSDDE